ncbi:MAG: tetratricopeptide repeat protein [Gammaproteobacteria bacterium]|nr:tetratricopeptide repeat protein [Gammaproteobacteria bacterium]
MKKHRTLIPAIAACALAWLAGSAAGQEAAAEGGGAEAKVIGDHVLVPVVLSTEAFRKETHLLLDYAATTPLHIFGPVFQAVRYGEGEETMKVLAQDGLRLEVPRDGVIPTPRGSPEMLLLGNLTNRYSSELKEIDVAAILGGPVLRRFALGMNLDESRVSFTLGADADIMDARPWAQSIITGVETTEEGRVLAPVSYGDGRRSLMAFNTAGYHSYVNADTVAALGHPSGDVPDIHFGVGDQRIGLSGMAALFPADFKDDPRFSPDWLVVPGLSLWTAYRLEINPVQGYLALEPVRDSNYSEADFAFYSAAAAGDRRKLQAYLRENPEDRNVAEAAEVLFGLGLEENASVEEQMEAVDYRLSATLERMKSDWLGGTALGLHFSEERDARSALIVALAEKALEFIARSDNPGLRQQLQLMLGDRYLFAGEAEEAWKVLLAAGFNGDPQLDGVVRHELGRAYEALGRHRRAYSSYQRALSPLVQTPPDMQESARAGMDRIRPLLDPDDPLLAEEES